MNRRELGKTGILLSELGYGCTAQFGKDFLGKPGITEDQAYSLVLTAYKLGIIFFDTGFNYGYCEERLGRCLERLFGEGIKREDLIIQTKGCETLNEDGSYGPNDYSPEWIEKSIEISLKRLKLDYVDLFAIHGAKPEVLSDRLFHLLEDLKKQGVIHAYGVSGVSDEFSNWISKEKCFDYVMMTYNYSEARRNPVIDTLTENGIGILSGGSLNRSLNTLRRIPRNRNELWYLARAYKKFKADLKRSKQFDFVNNVEGFTPQQVSLAYILENPNIASATFNTLSVPHLESNVKAAELKLPEDVKKRIEAIK